jgi:hypothetical protein
MPLRAAHSMSPKPIYLNDALIGSAATWWGVATVVSEHVGYISSEDVQHHGSEGPHGFYITLRSNVLNGHPSP